MSVYWGVTVPPHCELLLRWYQHGTHRHKCFHCIGTQPPSPAHYPIHSCPQLILMLYYVLQFIRGNSKLLMFIFKVVLILTETGCLLCPTFLLSWVGQESATPAGTWPYLHPSHLLEACNGVADGVHTHVAHVQLARGIREHGKHVKLGLWFLGKDDRKIQWVFINHSQGTRYAYNILAFYSR